MREPPAKRRVVCRLVAAEKATRRQAKQPVVVAVRAAHQLPFAWLGKRLPATGATPFVTRLGSSSRLVLNRQLHPHPASPNATPLLAWHFRSAIPTETPGHPLRLTVTFGAWRPRICGVVCAGRRSTVAPTRVTAPGHAGRRPTGCAPRAGPSQGDPRSNPATQPCTPDSSVSARNWPAKRLSSSAVKRPPFGIPISSDCVKPHAVRFRIP